MLKPSIAIRHFVNGSLTFCISGRKDTSAMAPNQRTIVKNQSEQHWQVPLRQTIGLSEKTLVSQQGRIRRGRETRSSLTTNDKGTHLSVPKTSPQVKLNEK
jgi:hypothetical protein